MGDDEGGGIVLPEAELGAAPFLLFIPGSQDKPDHLVLRVDPVDWGPVSLAEAIVATSVDEAPLAFPTYIDVNPTVTQGALRTSLVAGREGPVRFEVVDIGGRIVGQSCRWVLRGLSSVDLDLPALLGTGCSSGMYWLRVRGPELTETRRVLLMR